ncbi:hypothetical protein EON66_00085 [archaeon]|nr:MAG: hypothetical protein EON66_00085 [archaeon]
MPAVQECGNVYGGRAQEGQPASSQPAKRVGVGMFVPLLPFLVCLPFPCACAGTSAPLPRAVQRNDSATPRVCAIRPRW